MRTMRAARYANGLPSYSITALSGSTATGALGADGKGKLPHWRLTEKGQTGKANPQGLFEPPPNDFLKWDGTPFDPKPYRGHFTAATGMGRSKPQKTKSRFPRRKHSGTHVRIHPRFRRRIHLKTESGSDGGAHKRTKAVPTWGT